MWFLLPLLVALALPGQVAHAASAPVLYPRGVGADLGPTPATLGVTLRAGDDPAGLRTGTLDGHGYWQTQVAAGTTFLGVTPNAGYAASVAGQPLVAMVRYYDAGAGELTIGTTPVATLGGTNAWKQAAVGLAALPTELRLAGDSGGTPVDITIAQIRVTTAGPQITLGPTTSDTGIGARAGDSDSGLVTGTVAGRGFWQTNAAAPAPGLNYF